ncbi:hypothetical protein INR49_001147 [Caranx melampygus]|nr:hypothetical protein INR49_001147 [Caranx melampygus]
MSSCRALFLLAALALHGSASAERRRLSPAWGVGGWGRGWRKRRKGRRRGGGAKKRQEKEEEEGKGGGGHSLY